MKNEDPGVVSIHQSILEVYYVYDSYIVLQYVNCLFRLKSDFLSLLTALF